MLSVRFRVKWRQENEQGRHDFFHHEAYSLALAARPVQNLAEDAKSLDLRGYGSTILKYTQ